MEIPHLAPRRSRALTVGQHAAAAARTTESREKLHWMTLSSYGIDTAGRLSSWQDVGQHQGLKGVAETDLEFCGRLVRVGVSLPGM